MDDDTRALQEQLNALKEKFKAIEEANRALQARLAETDALYALAADFGSSLGLDELLHRLRTTFCQRFAIDHCALWLLKERFHPDQVSDDPALPIRWVDSDDLEATLEALQVGAYPIYIENLNARPNLQALYPWNADASLLMAKLTKENGEVLGWLFLGRTRPAAFTEKERELLAKTAQQIAMALEKALLFEQTKELSITDELTGIFNRRYFNQCFDRELQRCKRYNHPLGVVMLDIDQFKRYNDLNGHLLGDEVLKQVARILESNLRKADIIARYGGEEFVILLPEISKLQAVRVADKLRKKVERAAFPNEATQPKGKLTISLGIAIYPEDAQSQEKLLRLADAALYEAKSAGRNCVVCHGMPAAVQNFKMPDGGRDLEKAARE